MKTIKQYLSSFDNPYNVLFQDTLQYPEPLEDHNARQMALDSMLLYYGNLALDPNVESESGTGTATQVYVGIYAHQSELDAINRIMAAYQITSEEPDYIETKKYGEDSTTNSYGADSTTTNIGARSSTDNLGATSGTQKNTGTGYDSVTRKETTSTTTDTDAVTNSTSQAAAVDSVSREAHSDTISRAQRTDTIEKMTKIDELKSAAFIHETRGDMAAPVFLMVAKLLAEIISIPFYPEV